MNPHPFFREQIAADRRQALIEQANVHRLLDMRGPSSKQRRGLARLLRLARRRQFFAPPTPAHATARVVRGTTNLPEPAQ